MENDKTALVENLAEVDAAIQKLLLVQVVVVIVYALLFFDGLAIKKETEALQRQSQTTAELLSRFAWLDSLSAVFARHPAAGQEYQTYLGQFRNSLSRLRNIDPGSYYYAVVVDSFLTIDPGWQVARSQDVFAHVQKLAQRGGALIDQQLYAVKQLRQPQPLDNLAQAVDLRKALEPSPGLLDTMRLLVNKVYPEISAFRGSYRGLPQFLSERGHPQSLPPLTEVEKAIHDVTLFVRAHDLPATDLDGLKNHQEALADSIRANEQQKGKIYLTIVEQSVSVKLAFELGLPLLVFFNHLLLLLLGKKVHLHKTLRNGTATAEGVTDRKKSGTAELSTRLSPTLLNFLFTGETSVLLKGITWIFFCVFEIAVILLGLAIFWYLLGFLPAAERSSSIFLNVTAVFLLIHVVQVLGICVRVGKI
jgi:hypothetical protein